MRRNAGSETPGGSPEPRPAEAGVPFGSNAVRLSGWQWIVAAGILVASFCLIPGIWERIERFEPDPDYRIPYQLSNDYWLYARACRHAASQDMTLVVGDSVIWGQYVPKDQTLLHHLNALAGEARFANLGVDGSHPAALAGLLAHYGRAVSDKQVIVHCNPLWMSSDKHDLQTDKEFRFNHPRLVPQFRPRIACYTAPYSDRIGIVIERCLPLFSWANHLRTAYFGDLSLPGWTLEHPYGNPFRAITLRMPASTKRFARDPLTWTQRGVNKAAFPWVELAGSFQWRSFRRLIEILRERGNRLFVLVGPFNEHMLQAASADAYAERRRGIAEWLEAEGIPHFVPPVLPSDYYADASHPLGVGYAMLAKQVLENGAFIEFDGR